jgi:hypothetical protein
MDWVAGWGERGKTEDTYNTVPIAGYITLIARMVLIFARPWRAGTAAMMTDVGDVGSAWRRLD